MPMNHLIRSLPPCALLVVVACGGRIEPTGPGDLEPQEAGVPGAAAGDAARFAEAVRAYTDRCRREGDELTDGSAPSTDRLARHWDALLRSERTAAELGAWLERCTAALETEECNYIQDKQSLMPSADTSEMHPDELLVAHGAYWDLLGPPACTDAPAGRAEAGRGCTDDVECASARCDLDGPCGTCMLRQVPMGGACHVHGHLVCGGGGYCNPSAPEAEDGTCDMLRGTVSVGGECNPGLICEAGARCAVPGNVCVPYAKLGERCELHEDCERLLVCQRGTNLAADDRVCIVPPETVVPRAGVGESCAALRCGKDLACSATSQVCEELPREGARCSLQCANGLTCTSGTCTKLPAEGEACASDVIWWERCAAGHACGADGRCHAALEDYCP